jgi:fumarylacetoacetase
MSGCPLNTGDLIATGTASGPSLTERGCLLEFTEPIKLDDGGASASVFPLHIR